MKKDFFKYWKVTFSNNAHSWDWWFVIFPYINFGREEFGNHCSEWQISIGWLFWNINFRQEKINSGDF